MQAGARGGYLKNTGLEPSHKLLGSGAKKRPFSTKIFEVRGLVAPGPMPCPEDIEDTWRIASVLLQRLWTYIYFPRIYFITVFLPCFVLSVCSKNTFLKYKEIFKFAEAIISCFNHFLGLSQGTHLSISTTLVYKNKIHLHMWQAYFCFVLVHWLKLKYFAYLFLQSSLKDWVCDVEHHIITQMHFAVCLSGERFVTFGVVTWGIRENSENEDPKNAIFVVVNSFLNVS